MEELIHEVLSLLNEGKTAGNPLSRYTALARAYAKLGNEILPIAKSERATYNYVNNNTKKS